MVGRCGVGGGKTTLRTKKIDGWMMCFLPRPRSAPAVFSLLPPTHAVLEKPEPGFVGKVREVERQTSRQAHSLFSFFLSL